VSSVHDSSSNLLDERNALALNTPVLARRLLLAASCSLVLAGAAFAQSPEAAPRVKLSTSMGDIVVELAPEKAPKTVQNFLQYVKDKHYDGTIFHRVIDGFMIQGGGFTSDLAQKPTREPIPLEASNGLKNDSYTIAMARTGNPNSATSQFFINVKNNDGLNAPSPDGYGYAVFGKVVAGKDVVDKIRAVPTGTKNGMQNVPVVPVVIQSATLAK
jgi:peptidyl-prolyl cis-trans isomerase A (cyclophilin A)